MLKRHQACIDLHRNKLIIQGTEASFLGEAELPDNAKADFLDDPEGDAVAEGNYKESSGSSLLQQKPMEDSPQTDRFDANKIAQLTNLGFSREQVIAALRRAGGDVEIAAGFLF